MPVEDPATPPADGIDIALFSAGADRSREYAPKFVKAGAVVVDNSSAFRYDKEVPLVIAEINPEAVKSHRGIIANPNCSTMIGAMALWPLHKAFGLTRYTVATYQATSGAGQAGMDELVEQTRFVLDHPGEPVKKKVFVYQIAFNTIPQIDVFQDNDYTKEEMKFAWETHKIFGDESIHISATCVRVAAMRAHSMAIHAEFRDPITVAVACVKMSAMPGLKILDDPASSVYPMPVDVSGENDVFVGRIRKDISCENGLVLWVVGDQLLKGAALNTVQIAELLK